MPTPRRCVVNFANRPPFIDGQNRLRAKCQGLSVEHIMFDKLPPGCPEHEKVPYAFKTYAIEEASRRGFRTVLWIDSSGVPTRDLSPIFEAAERDGVFIPDNYGWNQGQWCSDRQLSYLGLTRDEALKQPHCSALTYAVCLDHPVGAVVQGLMLNACQECPEIFVGKVDNADGSNSPDPRCMGCRHDQSILSGLANQRGIPFRSNVQWMDYWDREKGREYPKAIIAAYPTYEGEKW